MEFGLLYHTCFSSLVSFFSLNIHFLCARQGENRASFISVAGGWREKKRSFFLSFGLRISNKYFICFFHRFSGLWVQKSLRGVNHIMMNTNFFVVTGMEYILMCFVGGDREIIA